MVVVVMMVIFDGGGDVTFAVAFNGHSAWFQHVLERPVSPGAEVNKN